MTGDRTEEKKRRSVQQNTILQPVKGGENIESKLV